MEQYTRRRAVTSLKISFKREYATANLTESAEAAHFLATGLAPRASVSSAAARNAPVGNDEPRES